MVSVLGMLGRGAVVFAFVLGAVGCGKTVGKLAGGEGALAADAKAVIAALAKSGIDGAKIKVYESPRAARRDAPYSKAWGGVTVLGGRIFSLQLRRAKAIDFKALKPLSGLRQLQVWRGALKKVEGLAGLPKLGHVDLQNCGIREITGLKNLPALKTLKLANNPLRVVRDIKNVGLKTLDFSKQKLERLERVESMPELRGIVASHNKLTHVSVANLPKLDALVLDRNQLVQLSAKNLPKLTVLDAKHNKLKRVELAGLPALELLELSSNKLTALPKIAPGKYKAGPPAKLKRVAVGKNLIGSLVGLESLQPKELFIESNKLTTLALGAAPPPASAEKKKTTKKRKKRGKKGKRGTPPPPAGPLYARTVSLGLERNNLTSLAGIERFTALRYLYLDHNKLTALSGVERLPKLSKIRVSHNRLTTLQPLAVNAIAELMATDNKIAAAPELFGKKGKKRPRIGRYDLRRNPLVGVAAALLYSRSVARNKKGRRGLYIAPTYRTRYVRGYRGGSGRYRSGRTGYRSRGSRYSSGGGYRSGK